ncbi:hypothetical protein Tco_1534127 [Tanacetum coccineum]
MAERDEEKTAFFTREGVFCYKRLPFGLKNAGATYQKLIDKVFSYQLGRNMEVHANDMLNPRKCSFGVEEGIFLGHLIMKQGIKANPSRVKAVSDLQPPKSVDEIQYLSKKLDSLNCFLSKGADKALPFMQTLKSYTSRRWSNGQKKQKKPFKE